MVDELDCPSHFMFTIDGKPSRGPHHRCRLFASTYRAERW